MPPKGGNAKKESGRAKKAENEVKKQETAEKDKVGSTPSPMSPSSQIHELGAQGER